MNKAIRIVLTVLVPLAGLAVAFALIRTRPKPAKSATPPPAAVVEVKKMEPARERAIVEAMGTVVHAKSVTVFPEVGGRIVYQSPNLVPGGRVKAGEVLVRLDARDYQLQVEQQAANVERAEFELKMEQSRKAIAEREWKLLGGGGGAVTSTSSDLALRKPHIKNARAALEAARSGLDRAKLNVERATIVAPFSAIVMEELVDVGQVVSPQTKLATLTGTDEFWVQVSIPVERLSWIRVPGFDAAAAGGGSRARIVQDMGAGRRSERTGKVVRLLGDLDPVGRMARVVVAIEDPLGLRVPEADRGLPLLLGAYVSVEIEGEELEDVFVIPRTALRGDDEVLTVGGGERLESRKVEVVFRRSSSVLVKGGLQAGDRLVTSRVATPVPGMKVQVRGGAPGAETQLSGDPAAAPGQVRP